MTRGFQHVGPLLHRISIHTPARGVTTKILKEGDIQHISIHTPARGVTKFPCVKLLIYLYFNPHSRKGSDGAGNSLLLSCPYFNPHSRKGSDPVQGFSNSRSKDFNPHSRKGSDDVLPRPMVPIAISIHTPARGVTSRPDEGPLHYYISIHTPARGVTAIFANNHI